jgi:hypothetical protein
MEQPSKKTEKVEHLAEIPEDWRLLRANILETFGEGKTDGLNIERVKDFIKERNLPATDFVIVEDSDISQLQEMFGARYKVSDSFINNALG